MSIEINKNLKKSVTLKDVSMAQSSIIRLISKDRRLPNFETPAFAKYANDNLDEFWVEDDGEADFPSKDKWDIDLWKSVCVDLEDNFSKKKFDFIIEVMKYLRKTGHPDFQVKIKTVQKEKTSSEDFTSKSKSNKSTVTSAGIVGVLGLVGGVLIGKPIVGAIVGIAIGVAIGYKKDNN